MFGKSRQRPCYMAHDQAEPVALCCHRSLGDDSSALWGEGRYAWWTATAHTSAQDTGSRQRSSHGTLPQTLPCPLLATNTLCWLTSLRWAGFGEPASAAALQPARPRERRYQRTKKREALLPRRAISPKDQSPPQWVRDCVLSASGEAERGLTWAKL